MRVDKEATLVSLLVVAVLVGGFAFSRAPETAGASVAPAAADLADLRIENEDKLVVPRSRVEDVWSWMVSHLVEDPTFLAGLDPGLSAYWHDEFFVDVYFDTPDLALLDRQNGVRHRLRLNLTDPADRKNGRQLMQVKLNHIDGNEMNRGELKYDIEHRRRVVVPDDLHPVLRRITPLERPAFKDTLRTIGIDPYELRQILINSQRRRSLYVRREGEPFISIRLDECSSEMAFFDWKHVELEPELNEIPYTAADAAGRAFMEGINARIVDEIRRAFPEIERDLTPKYNKAFAYFEGRIPLLRPLIRAGVL